MPEIQNKANFVKLTKTDNLTTTMRDFTIHLSKADRSSATRKLSNDRNDLTSRLI